jgi:hypothetical protein
MHMAKVYDMTNALRHIDVFIANNLGEILCQQETYLRQRYSILFQKNILFSNRFYYNGDKKIHV